MYTLGIDIGSTASKCLILKDGKEIVSTSTVSVGTGTTGPKRALEEVLKNAKMAIEEMDFIMATGYGRNSIDIADDRMSELSCHARGAVFLFPNVKTVIDIGGQDIKVLKINSQGMLENFVMNDKCAAGTGRFLEVMARVLEVEVVELGKLSKQSTKEVNISSTCTVFAESEVISQLAKKTEIVDIIKGIHRAVASKVAGLAKRLGVEEDVIMTGGVAKNEGIVEALESEIGKNIRVSEYTQHVGALGAALFGYKKAKKKK
ncbi:MAG: 2-hydroxyglutaryl-CoA dehydratase [Tissierellia bacterium]|nr:2-hydroxyglutaryl-CoA dehydratase [Tissierellia bacterium]